ncbi:MAG: beta-propeller domain-containing protein [Verrucomicrobia bacterium]|nr:beta-propeller domain-containing protein [Verrucomicrobiota bacterium]
MPLHAALGPKVQLKSKLSLKQRLISVTVPEGYSNVSVEMFQKDSGWKSIASAEAKTGVMRFKLPFYSKNARWRAVGRKWVSNQPVGSRSKFPAKFYSGNNSFDAINGASGGGGRLMSGNVVPMASSTTSDSSKSSADVSQLPEEADIWKIDGSTVYFFNQLRGLQVLDLSNPADPRLTASLRMPALGQDLYVIREADGSRRLVLLTQGWSAEDGQWTRISLVKFNGLVAEVTHEQEIRGGLSDSRLVGDRLILVTSEWKSTSVSSAGEWTSESRISEWILKPGEAPLADGETVIVGANPLIAAGADWLAVSVHPQGEWNKSEVSVFAIKPSGLESMGPAIRTEGAISSKFAISWSNHVLTTVSHKDRWTSNSVSVLENFRAWDPEVIRPAVVEETRLGMLELAKGENLYATRFAGDRVYVVTFLETDPLWVVDLRDPENPTVSGHLEVPGFSTYLQAVGNYLFSVGWESNTVAASLFDVTDPTKPGLVKRINLGVGYSYSEALSNEKAVKVLPEAGLVMIPVSSPDPADGKWKSAVQLLDLDVANGVLSARGVIAHEFEARRSELVGDALVSISQRELIAADITNRDVPSILSEVSLAWPVDACLEVGAHLIQIEDGNWNWYSDDRSTARISPNDNTEAIYAEIDLGEGRVKIAERRGNNLFVLRDTSDHWSWGRYRIAGWPSSGSNELVLDIYDVSSLPIMPLLGSVAVPSENSGSQLSSARFLWPHENRPAILMESGFSYWYGYVVKPAPVAISMDGTPGTTSIDTASVKPYWISNTRPQLLVFDVSNPTAPSASKALDFAPEGSRLTGTSAAANGLLVTGVSHAYNPTTKRWLQDYSAYQSAQVVDVPVSGDAVMRSLMDLPGELLAVSELDKNGFLAFSVRKDIGELQVSASDGYDAFLVSTLKIPAYAPCAVAGRRVYVAAGNKLFRNSLSEGGSFIDEGYLDVGWTPYSLRALNGSIVGSGGTSILATKAGSNDIKTWQFPTWSVYADRVEIAADGDLLVPLGTYGVERLKR